MAIDAALFSSASDEWATPADLFAVLDREFGFFLDVCATAENAKCDLYYSPANDGLAQAWPAAASPWPGDPKLRTLWMNPPYSQIAAWMRKAHESALTGSLVVCLVPARTDTRWWWSYAVPAAIRFLPGRLKFGGGKNSAPFPSAIIVMYPGLPDLRRRAWFWNWKAQGGSR